MRLTTTGQVVVGIVSSVVGIAIVAAVRKRQQLKQALQVPTPAGAVADAAAGQGAKVFAALAPRIKALIGYFQLFSVVVSNYGTFPSVVQTVSHGLAFANLVRLPLPIARVDE